MRKTAIPQLLATMLEGCIIVTRRMGNRQASIAQTIRDQCRLRPIWSRTNQPILADAMLRLLCAVRGRPGGRPIR